MVGPKRARKDWQKELRAETILCAAEDLFESSGGQLSAISDVAKQAGIAKGTVYIYYNSKEEVYFAVLQRHMEDWVCSIENCLKAHSGPITADLLTDAYCDYINKNPRVLQLASLSHSVLEKNIDEDVALRYKHGQAARLMRLAREIVRHRPEWNETEAAQYCLHAYAFLLGLWQLAEPPEVCRKALQREDLKVLSIDFDMQARKSLHAWWRGLLG